jgi:glycosyltransferase involved in cell wall biosynthesis
MSSRQPDDGANVLFVSGLQLHPARSGGTLRSCALVNALRHHGFGVGVHSLTGRKVDYLGCRRSSTQVWPSGTEEYVDRGIWSAPTWLAAYVLGLPPLWITAYLAAATSSPGEVFLPRMLRRRLRTCHTVVADFPFLHPILLTPSARGKLRILSTHNVEHRLCTDGSRWSDRLLRDAVHDIEVRAAGVCDTLVACSVEDAGFFTQNTLVRETVVVPNGVDVRRFVGIEVHRARTRQRLGIADDVKLFVFTASRWAPNCRAFDYLLAFAREHGKMLLEQRIHILVVGNVTPKAIRLPALTATGGVKEVEPYLAAADAAINPIETGAGTNVKMGEFMAVRLPILSTEFGARGLSIEHGRTGFIFETGNLAALLSAVRRLFDEEPARLRQIAADAYRENQRAIDMDACVRPLAEAIARHQKVPWAS